MWIRFKSIILKIILYTFIHFSRGQCSCKSIRIWGRSFKLNFNGRSRTFLPIYPSPFPLCNELGRNVGRRRRGWAVTFKKKESEKSNEKEIKTVRVWERKRLCVFVCVRVRLRVRVCVCFAEWGKLTRGLAPQYQDLTRCVRPPSRWDLQPPKPPPPPPPLSELLSSLHSSSSSSSKSRSRSPATPRRPLPIISASLPSQPPSLSYKRGRTSAQQHNRKCLILAPIRPIYFVPDSRLST